MSLISRRLEQKAAPLRRIDSPANIQLMNSRLVAYKDNQLEYINKGYDFNDTVYSIIKLITDKIKVAQWGMYKIEDEQAYKQLRALQSLKQWTAKDYVKAVNLQRKAMKPADNAGKWGELMQWANENEPMPEFVGNAVTYKLITGNEFIYGNILPGGLNAGTPYELQHLPAQYTNLLATDTFPARVQGYYLTISPDNKYAPNQVLHLKYFNPDFDVNGSQLYGMSPLKSALTRLKKSNELTRAEAAAFQNDGVKGLMFMKNQVGIADGAEVLQEVRALKETMITEWSGPSNKGRIGISGYELGYIPVGLTSEEMQMIQTHYVDLRSFCNIFGVQSQLLNDPENKIYSNVKEAEKSLTSRCALPELNSVRNSLNRKGNKEWGMPKGQVADYDLTCYPELQADVKETATWTSQMVAIIPNEQRELCGLSAIDDPVMNEPWIQTNSRQPLADYQANIVDQQLQNDTGTGDIAG